MREGARTGGLDARDDGAEVAGEGRRGAGACDVGVDLGPRGRARGGVAVGRARSWVEIRDFDRE